MKKKTIIALCLACILLTGRAAAWSPVEFSGGSPSGILEEEDGSLLVSDVYNRVVWRIDRDGGVERAAGQIGVPALDGRPIGPVSRTTSIFTGSCGIRVPHCSQVSMGLRRCRCRCRWIGPRGAWGTPPAPIDR